MNKTKSFDIPKQLIWRAYKRVSKNKGAAIVFPKVNDKGIIKYLSYNGI